jgi:hypothetical protein
MTDRYFLVTRNRYAGKTEVREFGDAKAADTAYADAEREYFHDIMGQDPRLEIVLIGGESLAEVRRAYPHYFTEGSREQRRERMLRSLPSLLPR